MSIPLLVKGAWFLEGPMNGQPKSTDLLVGLTYHELLHTFVVENLGDRWPTPLIQEYSAESPRTKNHLHVYAVMTAVYESLGWQDKLAAQKTFDSSLDASGDYRRAMQIIDERGSAPFLAELSAP